MPREVPKGPQIGILGAKLGPKSSNLGYFWDLPRYFLEVWSPLEQKVTKMSTFPRKKGPINPPKWKVFGTLFARKNVFNFDSKFYAFF